MRAAVRPACTSRPSTARAMSMARRPVPSRRIAVARPPAALDAPTKEAASAEGATAAGAGATAAAVPAPASSIQPVIPREELKAGIASFYDESSSLWEDMW